VFNVRVALNTTVQRSMQYFRADVNLDLARLYRIDDVQAHLAAVRGSSVWRFGPAPVARSCRPTVAMWVA